MRRTHLITTAALVAACAMPATAAAQGQDLRSPDARDAAAASTQTAYQDLRSPGNGARPRLPPVQVAPVVEIRDAPGNGFDWGDAGIGAAGLLAMLSIAGAGWP